MAQTGLQKSPPGVRHVIPTREAYDAMIDTVRAVREMQNSTGQAAVESRLHDTSILIRNDSSSAVGRYGVLGLNGPLIRRMDNERAFLERVVMKGVEPTTDHIGRFAVTLEPIAAGRIGRAVIDGIVLCQVDIAEEGVTTADVIPFTDRLQTNLLGTAQLLYIEPDEEADLFPWCIVRLGNAGAQRWWLSKITGAARIGTVNRWRYSHVEQTIEGDAFVDKVGGISGTTSVAYALNLREANNKVQGDGIQGNGVNQSGASYPPGFAMVPIRGEPVFWMTRLLVGETYRYFFGDPNTDDGTCED